MEHSQLIIQPIVRIYDRVLKYLSAIFQLRLISYTSVDSIIERDSVLDILDKADAKRLCNTQQLMNNEMDLNNWRVASTEKGILTQHRREYYNDFEDCIRSLDYKNAKIKSLQKQTKIHMSDGDNGDSDSDYVDCQSASDLLKNQSSLSSKSMPQVPIENICEPSLPRKSAQKAQKETYALVQKSHEAQTTGTVDLQHDMPKKSSPQKSTQIAQVEVTAQPTSMNTQRKTSASIRKRQQPIDSEMTDSIGKEPRASEKKEIDTKTSRTHVKNQCTASNDAASDKVEKGPVERLEENAKTNRKSCKKKVGNDALDRTQRWFMLHPVPVFSEADWIY